MTLDTRIFITDPLSHREVFNKVNDLLSIPDTRVEQEGPTDGYWSKYGDYEISNRIGQGFDAWVTSYANQDGSRIEIDREPDEDGEVDKRPDYYVQISMDTAYGYQGPNGEGCATLHAKVIVDLGLWLHERGVGFSWQNEFTGDIHQGFEGIEEFLDGGEDAQAWFRDVVQPAIPHILGREK